MKRKSLLAMPFLAVWGANAFAAAPTLSGEFGFTGMDACLYSSLGFNPNLTPATGSSVYTSHSANEGILTFNKGKGTSSNSLTTMTTSSTFANASSSSSSYSFTYITFSDDSFTITPGTLYGKDLTGPSAGQTHTITGLAILTGLISSNGATLTAATLTPTVETVTHEDGSIVYRICQKSRVLELLKPGSAL
jgi:hypothetical protein